MLEKREQTFTTGASSTGVVEVASKSTHSK